MKTPPNKLVNRLGVALLLALYLVISFYRLGDVPLVYEDEPWLSSIAWKFGTEGVLGSDLFAGWHGMETHCYAAMPVYLMLLGGFFKIFGVGVMQARAFSVLAGLGVLIGTHALARRIFPGDGRIALGALLVLVLVRWTGSSATRTSGIFLLDMVRIARYEPLVSLLGLLTLHLYLSGQQSRRLSGYAAAGFFAGLTTLTHLYGVFWLPILLALTLQDRGLRGAMRPGLCMLLACGLCWLPYLLYILQDPAGWAGQTSEYSVEGRFDVLNPGWYWQNLVAEPGRYNLGLLGIRDTLGRVGLFATLLLSVFSLRTRFRQRQWALLLPALGLPLLFAFTIHTKMMNYALMYTPFWALIVAAGAVEVWQRVPRVATVLASLVVLEGASRIFLLVTVEKSPYLPFIAQVRAKIPAEARVLALQNYWFGLEDRDYRSFVVPAYQSTDSPPLPFDQGIERIAPDLLLIDDRMRDAFAHPTPGDLGAGYQRWAERHAPVLVDVVEDPAYGRLEFWRPTR